METQFPSLTLRDILSDVDALFQISVNQERSETLLNASSPVRGGIDQVSELEESLSLPAEYFAGNFADKVEEEHHRLDKLFAEQATRHPPQHHDMEIENGGISQSSEQVSDEGKKGKESAVGEENDTQHQKLLVSVAHTFINLEESLSLYLAKLKEREEEEAIKEDKERARRLIDQGEALERDFGVDRLVAK